MKSSFLKAGHWPTLFAAFFYFDLSFMVWVMLGPLAVQIASDLQLTGNYQAGLLVFALMSVMAVRTRWRATWGGRAISRSRRSDKSALATQCRHVVNYCSPHGIRR